MGQLVKKALGNKSPSQKRQVLEAAKKALKGSKQGTGLQRSALQKVIDQEIAKLKQSKRQNPKAKARPKGPNGNRQPVIVVNAPPQQQVQQEQQEQQEEQQQQQPAAQQGGGAGAGAGGGQGGQAKEPKAAKIDIKAQEFTAGKALETPMQGLQLTAELFGTGSKNNNADILKALASSPPPSSTQTKSQTNAFIQALLSNPINVASFGGGFSPQGRGGLSVVRQSGSRASFASRLQFSGGASRITAFAKSRALNPRTASANRLLGIRSRNNRFARVLKTKSSLGRTLVGGSTRSVLFRLQSRPKQIARSKHGSRRTLLSQNPRRQPKHRKRPSKR